MRSLRLLCERRNVPWYFAAWCVSLFAMLTLLGCGEKGPTLLPVEGVVTLDGKPVDKASVTFMPAAGQPQPASGVTDAQGKFTLVTTIGPKNHPGAYPGDYNVLVTKSTISGVNADAQGLSGEISAEGVKMTFLVPEKYASPQSSGLKWKVEKGSPPAKFELVSQ